MTLSNLCLKTISKDTNLIQIALNFNGTYHHQKQFLETSILSRMEFIQKFLTTKTHLETRHKMQNFYNLYENIFHGFNNKITLDFTSNDIDVWVASLLDFEFFNKNDDAFLFYIFSEYLPDKKSLIYKKFNTCSVESKTIAYLRVLDFNLGIENFKNFRILSQIDKNVVYQSNPGLIFEYSEEDENLSITEQLGDNYNFIQKIYDPDQDEIKFHCFKIYNIETKYYIQSNN